MEVGDYTLKELIGIPSNATMGLMGVFIAYNVGYNLAGHEGISDRASAGIVSLSSWLILMPQVTPFTPEGATEPLLVPTINILGTYAVMAAGLVPPCSGVMLPWTTPLCGLRQRDRVGVPAREGRRPPRPLRVGEEPRHGRGRHGGA